MILSVRLNRESEMRGSDERSGSLFSYVDLETRVRGDHPLRTIPNAALSNVSRAFTALYTETLPAIDSPEKLLRAVLLQVFYGIRAERQLMERLEFDHCSAALSASAWMMRFATIRRFSRTATGCSRARSLGSSWRRLCLNRR
jgi:transposase